MVWSRHRSHPSRSGGPWLLVAIAALFAPGCKSSSWGTKPSWWSFGGTTPPASLAAAPAFDGEVTKPSEAAKPYPTTETPAAYSLTDSTRTDPTAGPAANPTASPSAVLDPTTVTYGSTPPAAEPAAPQAAPTATAAAQSPSAIGPQVGPYASLQPTAPAAVDPAAAATAGFAAAPAFGTAAPPAQDRYASADPGVVAPRGPDAWAAPPAASGDSRYGAATASRFSGGDPQPPFQPSPAMAEPAPAAIPAAGFTPGGSIDPAPSVPTPPPAAAPTAGGDVLPGGIAPPKRRQDPGYRPGGTSSYRPNRAILAGDEPPTGVLPASFEAAPSAP
jgi:S-DNA-T family DNA segregation ATPase FtsK/SpoIIIE